MKVWFVYTPSDWQGGNGMNLYGIYTTHEEAEARFAEVKADSAVWLDYDLTIESFEVGTKEKWSL